jgi:bifunctional DNA-binding transcriptional regulator/antitoxin component of YhaV-PrlF toxin-antitoxin module
MAIWQEDNPLRRRLEKKVRDKYNIDEGDELEFFIRVELGEEVYDFHHHNSDAFPVEYTTAPYTGTCMTCGEPIPVDEEMVRWATYGLYKVWEHLDCSAERGNEAYDRAEAEAERARMDAEYNAGKRDAETYRDNKALFGSDYAEAEQIKLERSGAYDY